MIYDIIIVGCGPAGMTAAIYALRANKKVLILEGEAIGGKIASSPLVENYPGFKQISGNELVDNLYEQVEELGGVIEFDKAIEIKNGEIKKVIGEINVYEGYSVILALGSKYRTLKIENEEDYIGNGVSFCVVCDGAFYRGEDVAVIGGGNSAIINAISLADMCNKVYVIQNLDYLTCEEALKKELKNKNNVEIIYNAKVTKYLGDETLEGLVINDERQIDVKGIFLSIGQDPDIDCVKELINLDERNYVLVNEHCATSEDGIFAAGDCIHKNIRQLTTAMNDGTIAALSAIDYLKKINK
ncbi:MAG: FAD-dependent oxidoreductase [Firmicutes bacterium]|nr:FAD-dependent oxidoreductase [Bacillota bacterium]